MRESSIMGGVLNAYPNQYYRTNVNTSPADLNKTITLQYQTKVPDGMGGFTVSWTSAATVWARKVTMRSDEAIQAMAETGTAVHSFRIRYRSDVKSSWRIKEGDKYMNIIGPPMERWEGLQRYLDIMVKEAA